MFHTRGVIGLFFKGWRKLEETALRNVIPAIRGEVDDS